MKNAAQNMPITHCPTCGSNRIHRITRNISGIYKKRPYTAKNVRFEECPVCGEQLFDRAAMTKLEQARGSVAKTRVPRKSQKQRMSA